ncbi:MAG: response regulator [Chloroflexi bacterium]|nr:response regulator [Chloroflexota bacterium]
MVDWNNLSTWQILLVEDEPDNLELIAETLGFFGLNVKTAANGIEGLQALQDFTPTLILLDLSMPQMDGWQMHRQLKADTRTARIPVVALTAHAMVGDKERVIQAGFDGYITKPINITSLLNDLKAVLNAANSVPSHV